ncbi:MAG TPA: c-type cytochrome [Burkholderiaceae bacterium]|nr:c-type cytochrome [Burkholderiaceae bacterium]
MKWLLRALIGAGVVLAGLAALVAWLNLRGEESIPPDASPASFVSSPELVKRGEYVARAGDCTACHTARGGAPFAGGRAILTPFGTMFSSNLTPDEKTGLGRWSSQHFWRAMHNGRSMDGRLLYPAFPYPNYTQITRQDSDALFAYLRSLPPVEQPATPHQLRFPYNTQLALAAWRAMFFEPEPFKEDPAQNAAWNRGAYLVRGLGHCNACHGERNVFGATSESLEFSGGLIPMQNWYAPSLASSAEAGVADWESAHVVALLKSGTSPRGVVMGPMAEVVYRSTQYLSDEDLNAVATFLKGLPQTPPPAKPRKPIEYDPAQMQAGERVYGKHCAGCHGDSGEGVARAYPALAGNRSVTMASPANLIRIVLNGGFLPATASNPRPYGMPPFLQTLDDVEVAAVATYLRGSWGNEAKPVEPVDVLRLR